ncbi:MAG TPA: type II secretion system protein GspK [Phycisphaerae bacterium]|nr:type II secretion system protein GspK [Phycisphaerae bacterium]
MSRRGTVLLAVLVLTAMAAMLAGSLMFRMRAETAAAANGAGAEQAYAAAMSGVERAMAILRTAAGDREQWFDNPVLLSDQLVFDDGATAWYFTVYAENPDEPGTMRFGLTDESGKLNLNVANERQLAALPSVTTEQVDSLLDYRDQDSQPRPEGAEQDYYDRLANPYLIKNGPLATVEELLLVKGFGAAAVYGEDVNLNGTLDSGEDDGDRSFPYHDNGDGQLDRGLKSMLTVFSYEPNTASDGQNRINLNGDLRGLESVGLPEQAVQLIQAYRADGNTFTHPADLLEMTYRSQGGAGSDGGRRGRSRRGGGGEGEELRSGVGATELAMVLDRLTTRPAGSQGAAFGRVNVNTASVEVLTAALTGVVEDAASLARRIIEARAEQTDEDLQTIAWLYAGDVVNADTFKKIAPFLTARGYQFSLRCVGFSPATGRFRAVEAVVDLGKGEPRIVYLRDITRLGRPLSLAGPGSARAP